MSQYPFIDIAVHEKVRERFARGEALVVFSEDLSGVLWANGAGARMFGNASIYDFIDQGPDIRDLAYRQMTTTAGQLGAPFGPRSFLMRVASGFERITVQASVEKIVVGNEMAVLFAAPTGVRSNAVRDVARRLIEGFDDPETHVAVIGDSGEILTATEGFGALALPANIISMLQEGVRGKPGHVLKRPVHIGAAVYPAAIAQLAAKPALNLLFVIAEDIAEAQPPQPEPEIASASPQIEAGAASEAAFSPNDIAAEDTQATFVFDRESRPARFIWRIDADGIFHDVSPELAGALGPLAADIDGKSFEEVAHRFGLDPDGRIAALLAKRNTWSGRTVYWPVEGVALKVPVDLAALPTYSRDHQFEGFRGFGIVRVGDVVEDPNGTGLNLLTPEPATPPSAPVAEATEAAEQTPQEPLVEPPALKFEDTPMRRYSDKVIRFEERRPASVPETLSSEEQAAFREIARKLGGRVDDAPGEKTVEPAAEKPPREKPALRSSVLASDNPPLLRLVKTSEEHAAEDLKDDLAAIKSFRSEGDGLTTLVAQQLPMALLVHVADRLIYANPEFFRLTGDRTLRDLEARGGIDALLERDESMNPDGPGMILVQANGERVAVAAKLQSVRWEGRAALLLALNPMPSVKVPAKVDEPAPVVAEPVAETSPVASAELAGLRAEVSELRSILETATDGVVVISGEGEIRSMNRSASALFNYDEAEVRGKPFAMLFAHESQRAVADYLAGLAGHGVASVLNDGREVIGREASGGRLPIFMTLGRLSSSASYCAVIRDITQWKRTEDELKNAKRAAETANAHKSDFLAKVSHEIRTPLNAIIGFSEMMSNERFGPIGNQRYIEYANDISRSGRHVLDIVNDLLDISKIEAGEMDLDFTAVRLNATVTEAISLLQPQANSQRVIVRTALSERLPDVVADTRSVKQILINILANAIKFTPSGGQIVVSTAYEPNGCVLLRIRDTGIGMTREELEQAMKPFKQAPSGAARQRGEGTGLGLPLTKAMAEANRATFSVSSTPNEGTLVEISFPSQRVLAD
ncbi:ATP-binding protein [Rhizobium sp. C4]|uniref:ATP-binding protein n=1 Tax=Rhizobium sp. C4 TaxID=1349800 RepID=UPI001E5EC1ED|nr:ATP-binding protein [Rhizobium sp. C4]MCD2172811.1 ATP-binding protein [Rhizobium sp. C4]